MGRQSAKVEGLHGWRAQLDPDGPLGPGNRVGLHEFLDTVLPRNAGLHPLWDGGVLTANYPICSG